MICLIDGSRFARDLAHCLGATGDGGPLLPADRELWALVHGGCDGALAYSVPAMPFWSRLVIVDQAPVSQFDALGDAAAGGFTPAGPVAAVAGTCPHLRGFHGRTWESAAGNLHLAAALPLGDWPSAGALLLPLVPTLAARDGVVAASAGTVRPLIKWINDLYLGDGKMGGVLTRTEVTAARADLLLAGIGLNVRTAPALPPSPFVPRTAAAAGIDLGALLREILAALERRRREALERGFASMIAEYRAASNVIGRRVRVYADGPPNAPVSGEARLLAAGVVRGIGDDLSLDIDGAPEPVRRGRLAFEEECVGRPFGILP